METRKRLYKNTGTALTLTERVKKDRNRQVDSRKNKFNANRNIEENLDDSVTTPIKPAPIKISQIKDKPAKLKAYIEQKRTNKLKEQLEQRSPFIPFVPIGRWVEKKESVKKPKSFTITTPVKKALMNDGKILKKSTIKEIVTTARKENAGVINKKNKEEPVKSRKKILGDFNNVQQHQTISNEPKSNLAVESAGSLDSTFEIISSDQEVQKKDTEPLMANVPIEEIKEVPSIITKQAVKVTKSVKVAKKDVVKKQNAKIVIPVKRLNREKTIEKKPVEELPAKKEAKVVKTTKSKSVQQETPASVEPVESIKEVFVKPAEKPLSYTYKFYKSSLDSQVNYISIQLKNFTSDLDSFIKDLPEEIETKVHQTIQQGNLLVKEKSKGFEDILNKFESSDQNDPKCITEDDVENYWILIYNEIEKFKDNLQYVQEAKVFVKKDDKRRRTRKTLSDTPSRRSRRLAESGDTPKHNPSCFGCTPVSASKVNTPKSAKKRRATLKKSIAFDLEKM